MTRSPITRLAHLALGTTLLAAIACGDFSGPGGARTADAAAGRAWSLGGDLVTDGFVVRDRSGKVVSEVPAEWRQVFDRVGSASTRVQSIERDVLGDEGSQSRIAALSAARATPGLTLDMEEGDRCTDIQVAIFDEMDEWREADQAFEEALEGLIPGIDWNGEIDWPNPLELGAVMYRYAELMTIETQLNILVTLFNGYNCYQSML